MSEKIKTPRYIKLMADGKAEFKMQFSLQKNLIGAPAKVQLQAFNPQSVDDLKPQEGDYLRAKFRALSAKYLGENGYHLDFSRPGVLMQSIPLLLPKSKGGKRRDYLKFHRNHTEVIEARIGWLDAAAWSEASGEQSAPGINVENMIDWRLAPNESRQLLSTPPLVDSVSLSVVFDFEKSHPELRDWQFWDMLGHEVDGQIVRLIVTQMVDYRHIGLVTEGADEEADLIAEKELKAAQDKSLRPAAITNEGSGAGCATKQTSGGNTMPRILQFNEQQTNELVAVLDLSEAPTVELVSNAVAALSTENADLKVQLSAAKQKAASFDALLTAKRASVSAMLAKMEEKPSNGMLKAIAVMGYDDLVELDKDYDAKLNKMFPAMCQDCKSKNVARRSSVEVDQTAASTGSAAGTPATRGNDSEFKMR